MNRLEPMKCVPITLANDIVTLEPIAFKRAADFVDAIDDSVFAYMPMRSSIRTLSEVRRYIEFQMKRTSTVVFAVIDNQTEKAIGSTSFMEIRPDHYGLEIGSTWIRKSARGTRVNPAMKHLMLEHAFENLDAIRVELKTDERNAQSRAAILKLGAEFEGIRRNHIIMPDGHFRNSACYSVVHTQWEAVCDGLLKRIKAE
ncbi:MAG: GNAT family N-acetyltransferase [Phycisphaerales bacterium]|nr:GNAT family N-acetyltransferase [Phycisphaerales bacterium]